MHDFYAAVDLVICRAGAMTVSELAATATPAIFVPLDRVGQRANARVLVDAGAATLVVQGAIGELPGVAASLIADGAARSSMAAAAAGLARRDASEVVAARVIEAGHG
jgi:UDP-N-acetylglucosamine--N-acetylmuramyl-(pentapeptide) pyrophosphoryl-undecaprenol N-acetylglucosamine transferase